jgi:hypothetical protein
MPSAISTIGASFVVLVVACDETDWRAFTSAARRNPAPNWDRATIARGNSRLANSTRELDA